MILVLKQATRRRAGLAALVLAGLLSACAGPCKPTIGQAPEPPAVLVSNRSYDDTVQFIGLRHDHAGLRYRISNDYQMLDSVLSRATGQLRHEVHVFNTYTLGTWKKWVRATDDQMNALKLVSLPARVPCLSRGCLRQEVTLTLPHEALKRRRDEGFRIQLYAESGEIEVIFLSPEQLRAQLDAVEHYLQAPDAPLPEIHEPVDGLFIAEEGGELVVKRAEGDAALRDISVGARVIGASEISSFVAVKTIDDLKRSLAYRASAGNTLSIISLHQNGCDTSILSSAKW